MKLILAILAFATSCLAAEADIYIVAGQSNGWRLSSISSVPGKAEHLTYYFPMGCTTRPDKSEAKIIECVNPKTMGSGIVTALRDHSGKDIVFIQYCVCGSSLGDVANWYPGDDPANGKVNDAGLYGSFTRYLADVRRQVEALGITWKVKALFWHQGESDVSRAPEVHEKNLRNIFIRFRKDLGAELPIVAAHIRELDDRSKGINRALDAVDAADARMIAVKADDLIYESPTNVHIKTEGCITLGKRMVEALKSLQPQQPVEKLEMPLSGECAYLRRRARQSTSGRFEIHFFNRLLSCCTSSGSMMSRSTRAWCRGMRLRDPRVPVLAQPHDLVCILELDDPFPRAFSHEQVE